MHPNVALAITLAAVGGFLLLCYLKRNRWEWVRELDRWMFGWGSPVTMAVFRIIIGSLCFINLAMIGVYFDSWFSEKGYVPIRAAERWSGDLVRLNLLDGVTDSRITAAVYIATMVAALLTALGLFTRVSSILLYILLTTLHHRNPLILHGGDTALRCACLYVAIAPSGAAVSLDRLLALRKQPGLLVPLVSLWPQRLVQIQVAIVYFTTVWHKWFGAWWKEGIATWFPANLREFDRFPVPEFIDRQPFLAITTYGTLLVELSLATLVFYRPFRKWVLLGGILLHGGIEYRMNIPLFAFLMCSLYVAFYEGEEVAAWWDRLKARFNRRKVNSAQTGQKAETAAKQAT